jgi:phospholipase C
MAAALPAQAAVAVQSQDSANFSLIAPSIQVTATASTNISNYKIRYFFYEPNLPWTPPAVTNIVPSGATVTVRQLDRTYTGNCNGRCPTMMANYVVAISVPNNTTVTPSTPFTASFRLTARTARGWSPFHDYSQVSCTTGYCSNSNNITLQSANGATPLWGTAPGNTPNESHAVLVGQAQSAIKHVIVIMQENRAFDNYFGTFPNPVGQTTIVLPDGNGAPGVDGVNNAPISPTTVLNSPCNTTQWNPRTTSLTASDATGFPEDLPHEMVYAKTSYACPTSPPVPDRSCNAMCGSVACTDTNPLLVSDYLKATYNYQGNDCTQANADRRFKQTVGHYVGWQPTTPTVHDVLWNYWKIGQSFLVQDRMFTPIPSYSRMTHLFMVSGWAAENCSTTGQPCPPLDPFHSGNPDYPTNYQEVGGGNHAWKEITGLLDAGGVSWAYYRGDDFNPRSANGSDPGCACSGTIDSSTNFGNCFPVAGQNPITDLWNPLPFFNDVMVQKNIMHDPNWHGDGLKTFLAQVNAKDANGQWTDALPQVSWIVPGLYTSEHPAYSMAGAAGTPTTSADPRAGQAYVTTLLKQIQKNPVIWNSTVVFLAWDDWGGYYDHVRPPREGTKVMYGPRAPAMVVSPWLGIGMLDHQTLSFDAYLKFIEDLWLGSQRVGLNAQGQSADNRPLPARENQPVLGDLFTDFDFYKVLPTTNPFSGLTCNWPPAP